MSRVPLNTLLYRATQYVRVKVCLYVRAEGRSTMVRRPNRSGGTVANSPRSSSLTLHGFAQTAGIIFIIIKNNTKSFYQILRPSKAHDYQILTSNSLPLS